VANKEVDDVLFGEESPFKQQFTDKTTGLFNEAAARNALAELKKLKTKEAIQNKEQVDKQFIEPAFENRIIKAKSSAMSYVQKEIELKGNNPEDLFYWCNVKNALEKI
jgi:hypothetical protein